MDPHRQARRPTRAAPTSPGSRRRCGSACSRPGARSARSAPPGRAWGRGCPGSTGASVSVGDSTTSHVSNAVTKVSPARRRACAARWAASGGRVALQSISSRVKGSSSSGPGRRPRAGVIRSASCARVSAAVVKNASERAAPSIGSGSSSTIRWPSSAHSARVRSTASRTTGSGCRAAEAGADGRDPQPPAAGSGHRPHLRVPGVLDRAARSVRAGRRCRAPFGSRSGPRRARRARSSAGTVGTQRWCDGLKPNRPVMAAGIRIEPPASLAWASGTMPAATAAAEPPEDPPAERPGRHGLCVAPRSADSVLPSRPNSELVVEHTIRRPEPSRRRR